MWTNASFEPSSGLMKPKPLSVLKNLTVPEIMGKSFSYGGEAKADHRLEAA
jgi:hypothetical protein